MTDRPYSRTRRHGPLLVTAGVLGRGTDGRLVDGGMAGELEQAFDNLEELLTSEGIAMDAVLRIVAYLVDADAMPVLNEVFSRRFAEPRPVRTTVQVAGLPGDARVEIEATVGC